MIFFVCVGLVRAAVVTLDSIEIYKKHEIFGSKPIIFFRCKGENKTILPDVKKKHVLYIFKGEESWQVYIDGISLNSFIYFLSIITCLERNLGATLILSPYVLPISHGFELWNQSLILKAGYAHLLLYTPLGVTLLRTCLNMGCFVHWTNICHNV